MNQIKDLIEKIKKERKDFGLTIPQGIMDNEVSYFTKKFEEYFNINLDITYLNFLRTCNGLEENGYIIYSSNNHEINDVLYGIIENNELWHAQDIENKKYVYYAESGQYTFVYDKNEGEYRFMDRYSGHVIKVFDSIAEMLEHILTLMLNN